MRKLLLIVLLVLLLAVVGWWKTSNHGSSAAAAVEQYIKALQAHDIETLVHLTHDEEREMAKMKAKYPEAVWPKLIERRRAANLEDMEAKFDYGTLALFPVGSSWKVTESRPEKHTKQNAEVSSTTVFVTVTYPRLEDSVLSPSDQFLKQTIVRFTVLSPANVIKEAVRVPAGDMYYTSVPLMVFSASWGTSMWGLRLSTTAMGGTPPYSWTAECGSVSFTAANPNGQQVSASDVGIQNFQTMGLPKFSGEPVPCAITVKDATGAVDHGYFAVPKIQTPLMRSYCFERVPWVERARQAKSCIGNMLPMTPMKGRVESK